MESDVVAYSEVEFMSQGTALRGRLYARQGEPQPTVVMAHGFSATITMVADKYAEVFARAGFAVLLYDHAGFGSSDGEPRQVINAWAQAREYRDVLSYAATLDGVDESRMAVWGDSLSGGVALVVAAVDERVAAAVAQVPVCGPKDPPGDPEGELYAAVRQTLLDGDITSGGTSNGPMPVVSFDQQGTPSLLKPLTAFRWFIEHGARHGTEWQNLATHVLPGTPALFSVGLAAPHLRVPSLWLMCPTDEMPAANPAVARRAYDSATGEKELFEIDGGHFGLLYWPSDLFDLAAGAQLDFLNRVLR